MNFIYFLTRIFVWILIIASVITITLGVVSLLRINKEISSGFVLYSLIGVELILQVAYFINGIGILKNKLWASYLMVSFLSVGVLLQIINQDINLVILYIIIIFLIIFNKFFNKKAEGIRN